MDMASIVEAKAEQFDLGKEGSSCRAGGSLTNLKS
jgi:hypothetical protein